MTLRATADARRIADTTPGRHIELPYRWEASPIMWLGKQLSQGLKS